MQKGRIDYTTYFTFKFFKNTCCCEIVIYSSRLTLMRVNILLYLNITNLNSERGYNKRLIL